MNKNYLWGFATLLVIAVFGGFIYFQSLQPPSQKYMYELTMQKNSSALHAIYKDETLPAGVRKFAAHRYIFLISSNSDLQQKLEKELITQRDMAQTDIEKDIHKYALSSLNRNVKSKYRKLLVDKVMQIVGNKDRKGRIHIRSSKNQLPKSPPITHVDATIYGDLKKSDIFLDFNRNFMRFKPGFHGLSAREIAERYAEITTVGFAVKRGFPVGRYSGTCSGTAYRITASLFKINLKDNKIEASHSLLGSPPRKKIVVRNPRNRKCDGSGKSPAYYDYFKLTPQ